jgi:hypothetical protein
VADNVLVDNGGLTDYTVATDEVLVGGSNPSAQVQFVKLIDGSLNGTAPIAGDAANGLDVDVTRVGGTVTVSGTVSVSGAVDTELPAAAALADNTPNPTVPAVGAFAMGWDGANWDRIRAPGGLVEVADGGGSITVDGSVSISAVTPGTGASALGKAEDAVHASGDVGVMALAVRNDAGTAFAADGDYVPLSVDSSGAIRVSGGAGGTQYDEDTAHVSGDKVTMAGVVQQAADAALAGDGDRTVAQVDASGFLKVNVKAGSAGGPSKVDDAAFSIAVDSVAPIGALADETATDVVDEGDIGLVRMTLDRRLHVSSSYQEDVPAGNGEWGAAVLGVRNDSATTKTSLDGDYTYFATDAAGRMGIADLGGSITVDNGGTFAIQDSEKLVDNAAFTDGTTKVQPVGYIFDEVAGTALTENDAAAARIDSKRAQVLVIEDETTRGRRATVTAGLALKVDASSVAVPVTDNAGSLTIDNANLENATLVDNAAFTDGTTRLMMSGFIFDEVAGTALTENDAAAARVDSKRAVVATIEDATTRGRRATVSSGGGLLVDQGAAGTAWEVVGDVAHDAAAPANPVLVGAQMETMADSAPGTRAGTDGDAVKLASLDGAAYVLPTGPQTWTFHATGVQTGAQVHAAPGAGLSIYITSITFSIGGATASSIKVLNNGGADIWGPHYLEAVNGRGLHVVFNTPLKVTANTRLDVTTTGHATSTVDIEGFIAPG